MAALNSAGLRLTSKITIADLAQTYVLNLIHVCDAKSELRQPHDTSESRSNMFWI